MNLGQLSEVINGLIKVHGEMMDARFLYQFASGRTKSDTVVSYEVNPPKSDILKGWVLFRVGYTRGNEE
jgi:hypothetical protein